MCSTRQHCYTIYVQSNQAKLQQTNENFRFMRQEHFLRLSSCKETSTKRLLRTYSVHAYQNTVVKINGREYSLFWAGYMYSSYGQTNIKSFKLYCTCKNIQCTCHVHVHVRINDVLTVYMNMYNVSYP